MLAVALLPSLGNLLRRSLPAYGLDDPALAATAEAGSVRLTWLVLGGIAVTAVVTAAWFDRTWRWRRMALRAMADAHRFLEVFTEPYALERGEALFAEAAGRDPSSEGRDGSPSAHVDAVVADLRRLSSRGAGPEPAAAAQAAAFSLLALRVAVDAVARGHCGALLAAGLPEEAEAIESELRSRRLLREARARLTQSLVTLNELL